MTAHYWLQRELCVVCLYMRLTVDETGVCRSCRRADEQEQRVETALPEEKKT